MKVSMIVAMDPDRVIGLDNNMPWHISEDLKYFKRVTLGAPVLMGRKTHESIGRPLPGRQNLILTRNRDYTAEGCEVVHDLDSALERAAEHPELMIIGGSELYRLFLERADCIYLTRVHARYEGDTWFPELNNAEWDEALVEAGDVCDWVRLDRKPNA